MSTVPPPPGEGPPGYPPAYSQQPGPRNGAGVTALVTGITGAVLAVFLGWLLGLGIVLGIPLGVVALIFGFLGRGRAKRGEATNGGVAVTGAILGVVALLASAAWILVGIFLLSKSHKFTDYADCVSKAKNDQAKIEKCGNDFKHKIGGLRG